MADCVICGEPVLIGNLMQLAEGGWLHTQGACQQKYWDTQNGGSRGKEIEPALRVVEKDGWFVAEPPAETAPAPARVNPFWFFDGSPVVEPAAAKTTPAVDPWHAVRD